LNNPSNTCPKPHIPCALQAGMPANPHRICALGLPPKNSGKSRNCSAY
jgi:hypothetical protein